MQLRWSLWALLNWLCSTACGINLEKSLEITELDGFFEFFKSATPLVVN